MADYYHFYPGYNLYSENREWIKLVDDYVRFIPHPPEFDWKKWKKLHEMESNEEYAKARDTYNKYMRDYSREADALYVEIVTFSR
jgi:intein/homing endonuclease